MIHHEVPQPETAWLRVGRPDLRIISDDDWNAAPARIQRSRASQSVALADRLVRGRDGESKYLLAGFARCARCGGTLSVVTRQHGKRAAGATRASRKR